MVKSMNRKTINFIGILFIFLIGFIVHGIYEWFPNTITMIFFPINESIFEHVKMIFTSYLIWIILKKKLLKENDIHINNYIFLEMITIFILITIFLLVFIPVYKTFGENLLITLFIYFISITISQVINYFLAIKKDYKILFIISIIVVIFSYILFIYYVYKPPINWFFLDPTNNSYGLNK